MQFLKSKITINRIYAMTVRNLQKQIPFLSMHKQ